MINASENVVNYTHLHILFATENLSFRCECVCVLESVHCSRTNNKGLLSLRLVLAKAAEIEAKILNMCPTHGTPRMQCKQEELFYERSPPPKTGNFHWLMAAEQAKRLRRDDSDE